MATYMDIHCICVEVLLRAWRWSNKGGRGAHFGESEYNIVTSTRVLISP